jgi:hypothetical protein
VATTRDADGFCSTSTKAEDAKVLGPFLARLGDTPDAWLMWVVGFAQRDLATVGPGERQDLGQDLRALPTLVWRDHWRGWRPKTLPMPEAMLLQLQAHLREGLQRFVRGGWGVPGQVILGLVKHPRTGRHRVGLWSAPSAWEDGGIVAAVVELLCQVGDRLKVCPARDCGRIFVSYRKQKFCSPKHAQQARNEKSYKSRKAKERGITDEDKVKINHRRRS